MSDQATDQLPEQLNPPPPIIHDTQINAGNLFGTAGVVDYFVYDTDNREGWGSYPIFGFVPGEDFIVLTNFNGEDNYTIQYTPDLGWGGDPLENDTQVSYYDFSAGEGSIII